MQSISFKFIILWDCVMTKRMHRCLFSINTDDRGVFHTSLENEYALLASSIENLRDKNGEKLYTPQQVYEWLDRIRVMGNYQVF